MTSCLVLAVAAAITLRADELSDAFDQLKAAEAANDGAAIEKWAKETSRLARAELALPPSDNPTQKAYHDSRLVYLEQTDVYTEYALAVGAGRPGVPPDQVISMVDTLIAQKPESEYLPLAVSPYLTALRTKDAEAQRAGAERILELLPGNEDALMAMANYHNSRQENAQAMDYAMQVIDVLENKAMPEGFGEEAWNQKKNSLLGRAYLLTGLGGCAAQEWGMCVGRLEEARVTITNPDPYTEASIYFYLGYANYQLAQESGDQELMEQAIADTRKATEIDSPLKEQAEKNLEAFTSQMANQ